MTREEAASKLKELRVPFPEIENINYEALDMAIQALEQEPKPMEKFESTKDHIFKLAGDYKCWDNRLTWDEALELCHILEQEPSQKDIYLQGYSDAMKEHKLFVQNIKKYMDNYNYAKAMEDYRK